MKRLILAALILCSACSQERSYTTQDQRDIEAAEALNGWNKKWYPQGTSTPRWTPEQAVTAKAELQELGKAHAGTQAELAARSLVIMLDSTYPTQTISINGVPHDQQTLIDAYERRQ